MTSIFRLIDREIGRFRPAQDLVHIICRVPESFNVAWSVGHERAGFNEIVGAEDRRYLRAKCDAIMFVRFATMS